LEFVGKLRVFGQPYWPITAPFILVHLTLAKKNHSG
jgi:hypothetical protein